MVHFGNRKRGLVAAVLLTILLLVLAIVIGRRQTVDWRWRHYNGQIRDAMAAGDGRDVTEAITFFENATGITSHAATNEAGRRTVVPAVAQEIPEWDAWYASHRPCLEWDIRGQRLALRKGCED